MTEDEMRHIADMVAERAGGKIADIAAEKALSTLLMRLGIDVDEPVEMQRDMSFVRNWRQSAEAVKRQGMFVAVGILVVGMLGLIWAAVKGP